METAENIAKEIAAKLSVTDAHLPSTYWQTGNGPNNSTSIVVPSAGTLWVLYAPSDPPVREIYVFHAADFTKTPINPGENTIPVSVGDAIVYKLLDPAIGPSAVALGFQML